MKRIFIISIAITATAFMQLLVTNQKHWNLAKMPSNFSFISGEKNYDLKYTNHPVQSWFPVAPKLTEPTGDVIRVTNVAQLYEAVEIVKQGGTIAIADGQYNMPRSLVIRSNDVTIRSESDDRTKVILDFESSMHGEGVVINSSTGFMLASLTVRNVTQNGIKINSNLGVDKVTIFNVISHNIWQRHIKGPSVPDHEDGTPAWVEDCYVQYCLFYNDRPKRLDDDPYEKENPDNFNGNYVGGIDIMNAKGWIISDNVFIGIRGRTGSGRGSIFMWHNGFDCIIERNIFIDNDSGICLGNSSARGERRHCTGFIVRNNFITRTNANEGIFVGHTRDCQILHNSVHNPGTGRLIRIAHANDGLFVAGNVFSGSSWGVNINEDDNQVPIIFRENLIKLSTQDFVDPENGNLHLKESAVDIIDKGTVIENVVDDIDSQPRDDKPDLGADEYGSVVTGMKKDYQINLLCSVFPNPTNDNLTLKVFNQSWNNVFYQLYDFNGKLIENRKVTEAETVIQMGGLKPAVYSLIVYDLSPHYRESTIPNFSYIKQHPGYVKTIKIIKK
jgi:hypothetical protein